jgi:hypothetical protein
MATKKAIELIQRDIDHYNNVVVFMNDLTDSFFKNHNFDDTLPDSMRSMIKKCRQSLHEMIVSTCKDQIKYYEDILAELEPKKI